MQLSAQTELHAPSSVLGVCGDSSAPPSNCSSSCDVNATSCFSPFSLAMTSSSSVDTPLDRNTNIHFCHANFLATKADNPYFYRATLDLVRSSTPPCVPLVRSSGRTSRHEAGKQSAWQREIAIRYFLTENVSSIFTYYARKRARVDFVCSMHFHTFLLSSAPPSSRICPLPPSYPLRTPSAYFRSYAEGVRRGLKIVLCLPVFQPLMV